MFIISVFTVIGQIIYSWTPNVNPGWTSSNPSVSTLGWQSVANIVSTSDQVVINGGWYTYDDSQITTYTSPLINTTCLLSSAVVINFTLDINLENRRDWLYFQYSSDGGTTWLNPVVTSGSINNSFVNLSPFLPLTAWVNNNSNRNGWTNNIGVINLSYTIPSSINSRFRFIFASNFAVNTYGSNFIYYADISVFRILCTTQLPIELIDFVGYNEIDNVLEWETATEKNNDYFTLEHSENGTDWNIIGRVDGKGDSQSKQSYNFKHQDFKFITNYYKLSQTDFDGVVRIYNNHVAINNTQGFKHIVRVINLLGQTVDINTTGVKIVIYSDGTIKKIM
jgi:hypothetical protein